MSRRSYEQICGVAHALDLLGERWTLLIIRELMPGPKRFGSLRAALDGVSANMLSSRLGSLAEDGLVERIAIADSSGAFAYGLTDRGKGLRPVVDALAVWGSADLDPPALVAAGWSSRGSWLASSLVAGARRHGRRLADARVNFDIDGDRFAIVVDGGEPNVYSSPDPQPDGALACDLETFFHFASGDAEPADPVVAELIDSLPSFAEISGTTSS